jgi:paraquat-inducible protein B
MAKQVSKTVIGGFVISAIALLIGGIIIFGGGKFFMKTVNFVLFFDGTVKGLKVGAPVVWRGVRIGEVADIFLFADSSKLTVDIPVVIALEPDQFKVSGERLPKDPYDKARIMIDRGLRGQLVMESMVTGQLMVAMDFYPEVPAELTGIDIGYPELPTIKTDFERLAETVKNLPLKDMVGNLNSMIAKADELISSPEIKDIIRNFKTASIDLNDLLSNADDLVTNTDKLMVNVNQQVKPVSKELQATMGDIRLLVNNVDGEVDLLSPKIQDAMVSAKSALDQAAQTLKTYEHLVDDKSALRNDVAVALNGISLAARSFQAFFDYLEQHPEALLQGKGSGGGQ